jgi:hypothetical protein
MHWVATNEREAHPREKAKRGCPLIMMQETYNPYAPPLETGGETAAAAGAEGVLLAPSYQLYSPGSMVLVTFLGTPLAGGVLLALNFHRLGLKGSALKALLGGVFTTMALYLIAQLLPERSPLPGILLVPQLMGVHRLALHYQGRLLQEHQQAGGKLASSWRAAGLGLLSLLAVLTVFIVGYLLLGEGT